MKPIKLLICFIAISGIAKAQSYSINTFAGNGTSGFSGDGGVATSAELRLPCAVAVDNSGNVYIADVENWRIRKVNTSGIISTFAGNGQQGYSGDGGAATSAKLFWTSELAADDSGNVYIADEMANRIRKVNTSGIISTIAGNGFAALGSGGFSGDGGPATAAELYMPCGVALDGSGNVYIADLTNERVRKVNTNGIISTFAGIGKSGFSGDNGPATSAELWAPSEVAVNDSGNVYIADQNNNRIRKVNTNGTISTFAGIEFQGYSGDGVPATSTSLFLPTGVGVDTKGNVYIADQLNYRIRKVDASGIITTIAGNGDKGFSGDGGPAINAELDVPNSVAADSMGNVFISDQANGRIRKLSIITGINEITQDNGIKVYPNPSNGQITFDITTPISGTLEIYDLTGQEFYQTKINSKRIEINIGNQPNGIYFYRVLKESGELVGEGKIIVQK